MKYTDLYIWCASRKMGSLIYDSTKSFSKDEIYKLTNQIQRSNISVSSDIEESCGRETSKDTIRLLHSPNGWLYEIERQLYFAVDQTYLDITGLNRLVSKQKCKKIAKWLYKQQLL